MDPITLLYLCYADLFGMFVMSLLAFALWGYDKHRASYGLGRVPEAVLYLVAIFGGAFGALCGMIFFNHKTKKTGFLVLIPILTVLQIAGLVLYRIFWYGHYYEHPYYIFF